MIHREDIEWCRIWVPDSEKAEIDRPRILLVGDSIVAGYGPHVAERMGDDASIAWLCTSRFPADPAFADEVMLVLRYTRFDIIHFNNGLHGFDYTEACYGQVLPAAVNHFRAMTDGTAWALATSTAIRHAEDLAQFGPRNQRVITRNHTVQRLAEAEALPLTDLYATSEQHPDWYVADAIHHNEQGQKGLADVVVQTLRQMMG